MNSRQYREQRRHSSPRQQNVAHRGPFTLIFEIYYSPLYDEITWGRYLCASLGDGGAVK